MACRSATYSSTDEHFCFPSLSYRIYVLYIIFYRSRSIMIYFLSCFQITHTLCIYIYIINVELYIYILIIMIIIIARLLDAVPMDGASRLPLSFHASL